MYPNSFGPRCWGDQHFHWNHPQQLQWQDRCQAGVRGSWANGRCQNEGNVVVTVITYHLYRGSCCFGCLLPQLLAAPSVCPECPERPEHCFKQNSAFQGGTACIGSMVRYACLQDVCKQAQSKWDVKHVAISHRLGPVAVSEASVVIAVSSAHRRAALEATHWAIDELKATVPIWKKEFFEDGSLWKENAESRPVDQPGPAQE
eukprot:GHRR01012896.1.p1 GENE.GHRR01012896.1~~GHRR01012896.1.p1  ORF type:complete len:203 (+),score=7.67 GHRR01012896.1:533-1141(+)